jgi:L-threonine kinase
VSVADLFPAADRRSASVIVPGTCGEWVQGTLDGIPCLISCPIGWYAATTVAIDSGGNTWRLPGDADKAATALRLGLGQLAEATGECLSAGELRLADPLPRSRGYASSTADVAGALAALGRAAGRPFTPAEVARIAVRVEPSDSTMFGGLALLAHRDASFWRELGPLPPLSAVALDPGGAVDTMAFNHADQRATLRRLAAEHRAAFALFEHGLAAGDVECIASAATLSALAHQAILPSELVTAAHAALHGLGALGLCRAHSGTLVGLICQPWAAGEVAARAQLRFPDIAVRAFRCLGTGEMLLAPATGDVFHTHRAKAPHLPCTPAYG